MVYFYKGKIRIKISKKENNELGKKNLKYMVKDYIYKNFINN